VNRARTIPAPLLLALSLLFAGCRSTPPEPPPTQLPPAQPTAELPEAKSDSPPSAEKAIRLEGEDLIATEVSDVFGPEPQTMGEEWSGGTQLWLYDAQPTAKAKLSFTAPAAGRYQVTLRPTLAPDYGIFQVSINGTVATESLDLYASEVKPGDPVNLGEFALNAGANEMLVEVVGRNPAADQGYNFGLDYIELTPVR